MKKKKLFHFSINRLPEFPFIKKKKKLKQNTEKFPTYLKIDTYRLWKS